MQNSNFVVDGLITELRRYDNATRIELHGPPESQKGEKILDFNCFDEFVGNFRQHMYFAYDDKLGKNAEGSMFVGPVLSSLMRYYYNQAAGFGNYLVNYKLSNNSIDGIIPMSQSATPEAYLCLEKIESTRQYSLNSLHDTVVLKFVRSS